MKREGFDMNLDFNKEQIEDVIDRIVDRTMKLMKRRKTRNI